MPGFDGDTVYGGNLNFSTANATRGKASITLNGQMLIGTTTPNAGGTTINVGTVVSPLGTLQIGYQSPNITIDVTGGFGGFVKTLSDNTNTTTSPTGAGNIQIETLNATPKFVAGTNLLKLDFGLSNLSLGSSLPSLTSGTANAYYGYQAGSATTTALDNVCVGYQAGTSLSSGAANVFVGYQAGMNSNVSNNTVIGYASGQNLSGSGTSVFIGKALGSSATTGGNVFIGNNLGGTGFTTGTGNIVIASGTYNPSTGGGGNANIIIGSSSGSGYTSTESNNILLSNPGTISESNAIHIGNQGNGSQMQNTCFIAGIIGVTNSNPVLVTINSSTTQMGVQALTQYNVVTGGASNAVNLVAPSATSGYPLVSQGSSAQPAYTGVVQATGIGIGASPGATAGLTFDGTNFLDNYATGSITPTIGFGGSSTGITYSNNTGKYTRIGNICHFYLIIQLSSKGAQAGNLLISGLPITVNGFYLNSVVVADAVTFPSGTTYLVFEAEAGGTTGEIYGCGTGTTHSSELLANTNFSNTSALFITGYYFV
jgi:hypothetical protein